MLMLLSSDRLIQLDHPSCFKYNRFDCKRVLIARCVGNSLLWRQPPSNEGAAPLLAKEASGFGYRISLSRSGWRLSWNDLSAAILIWIERVWDPNLKRLPSNREMLTSQTCLRESLTRCVVGMPRILLKYLAGWCNLRLASAFSAAMMLSGHCYKFPWSSYNYNIWRYGWCLFSGNDVFGSLLQIYL